MISIFQTEHFRNFRASGIGTVKQQAVEKPTKNELKQMAKTEICLNCTKASCKKGYCEIMKNNR